VPIALRRGSAKGYQIARVPKLIGPNSLSSLPHDLLYAHIFAAQAHFQLVRVRMINQVFEMDGCNRGRLWCHRIEQANLKSAAVVGDGLLGDRRTARG